MNERIQRAIFAAAFVLAASAGIAKGATSGIYTAQQATAGAKGFAQNCARCHGANLEGVSAPALKGPDLTAPGAQGSINVGDLFKYMTSLMPAGAPGSLSHDQYVAIMAFILKENGQPAGSKPLTYDGALHSRAPIAAKK